MKTLSLCQRGALSWRFGALACAVVVGTAALTFGPWLTDSGRSPRLQSLVPIQDVDVQLAAIDAPATTRAADVVVSANSQVRTDVTPESESTALPLAIQQALRSIDTSPRLGPNIKARALATFHEHWAAMNAKR